VPTPIDPLPTMIPTTVPPPQNQPPPFTSPPGIRRTVGDPSSGNYIPPMPLHQSQFMVGPTTTAPPPGPPPVHLTTPLSHPPLLGPYQYAHWPHQLAATQYVPTGFTNPPPLPVAPAAPTAPLDLPTGLTIDTNIAALMSFFQSQQAQLISQLRASNNKVMKPVQPFPKWDGKPPT
jgi:hypothetical protein